MQTHTTTQIPPLSVNLNPKPIYSFEKALSVPPVEWLVRFDWK